MQLEAGTPFDKWERDGSIHLPLEDDAVTMLAAASSTLRASGYEHYELSNYARPGHRSRHNMVYWLGHSYYAFGVGAASFLEGRRFSRPKSLSGWQRYVASVSDAAGQGTQTLKARQCAGGYVAGGGVEALATKDRMLEGLMLMLRLRDGVDLVAFAEAFGSQKLQGLLEAVQSHAREGLVEMHRHGPAVLNTSGEANHVQTVIGDTLFRDEARAEWPDANAVLNAGRSGEKWCLRLQDPNGLMVSNNILSDIFVKLDP